MLELAAILLIGVVLLWAIVRAARFLLIIAGAVILAANADAWLLALTPLRDWLGAHVTWAPLMLVTWAFGYGLATRFWRLYVWYERRNAHQAVDKRYDAMQ